MRPARASHLSIAVLNHGLKLNLHRRRPRIQVPHQLFSPRLPGFTQNHPAPFGVPPCPHAKRIRKAVFPVAGLGTRFLPATKAMPKEMLTVVDRPVIQHVVDEARAAGIEHFIFVTGRNKAAIEDHFDKQPELERTLAERGKTKELEELAARSSRGGRDELHAPAGAARPWATRSGARATSSATSRSRCCCPTCCITAQRPCLAEMIEAYDEHGGNHIAVSPVPEDQTHQYGIVGVKDRDGQGVGDHRHGREAQARHGAVQPAHHRPLYPAAGDLRSARSARSAAPAARSSSPTP